MEGSSDDLFTLIKSLDTREKIFFKVSSAKRNSGKNSLSYLRLFDALDKLKAYDKSLLVASLQKKGFKHDLKKAKRYLAKAILKSLREYHSAISINTELQTLLHEAEVLGEKKLHKLAKKALLKAEQLALKHERYDYLMVIYYFKTNIFLSTRNIVDIEDYINKDAPKETHYLERLKNTIEFRNLASQMRIVAATRSRVQGKKDIDKINSVFKSPLLISPNKALSFSSRRDYYNIHLYYAHLLDKWDHKTYLRQKEWLSFLESNKKELGYNIWSYMGALINLMLVQIKMGRFDETDMLYEKTEQFYCSLPPKKRTKQISAFFASGVFNYIAVQIERKNPEKALKTWEQAKGFISFAALDPNALIQGCGNLSYMYFILNNYHDALKWISKLLMMKEKNALNIQAMARIYLLVLHYELRNYHMLPYLAKSSKRFLIKHNYFFPFEELMVRFFEKRVHVIENGQKKKEAFKELKNQLESLNRNAKKILALEYFNYIAWVKSKIENRPFVEVLRDNR